MLKPRPDTTPHPALLGTAPTLAWPVAASVALAVPALLAYNAPPSATFLNQATALIGWGGFLAWVAFALPARWAPREASSLALLAMFTLLLAAALATPLWTGLPWSLALSNAGLIFAAMLAALVGGAAQRGGLGVAAFRALCIGLLVAGLASSAVGMVQVFAPHWADGQWIAPTGLPGRAVGNVRQPNHLSSLLLWSVIATLWLGEARVLRRPALWGCALVLLFVVVLSGSRTGALGTGVLAAWGLLDRRLSRQARGLLCLMPVAYGLFWLGAAAWADSSHHVFGGETRFSTQGDISSSRYGIWANTLALVRTHPWAGVGFGEFNFAWTLTPFPGRPVAFFDHTHNLPLQFAVELGLPLATAVLSLLAWALVSGWRGALRARSDVDPAQAPLRRAAFVMVLMILLHSLLEYPLWYAYFLLPAAFAFGLCLAHPAPAEAVPRRAGPAPARGRTRPLLVAAMLLMIGGIASVLDYTRVVAIFAPPEGAGTLAARIADGQRSVFFAHHADYAAATTAEHPAEAMAAFPRASHYLLDSRLMQAWAKALNEAGDTDRARYLAQRLKEFRNEAAAPFFAECEPPQATLPFQCTPPVRQFEFADFE